MKYIKPTVELFSDMPAAGGCGDKTPSSCAAMAYWKSGPGCGDATPSSCAALAYWH